MYLNDCKQEVFWYTTGEIMIKTIGSMQIEFMDNYTTSQEMIARWKDNGQDLTMYRQIEHL